MSKHIYILLVGLLGLLFGDDRTLVEGRWGTTNGHPPRVIGHRGERAIMPEHTVGAYAVAAVEGADYVEPDLMLTKDGVLICFSKFSLKDSTDVESHPEFQHLKTVSLSVDAKEPEASAATEDWHVKDFTLEQLKQLTVKQENVGRRPKVFNNIFRIPTFEEFLETIHQMSYILDHPIGIVPELRYPKYHNAIFGSHYMENQLLATLTAYGYNTHAKGPQNCTSRVNTNLTVQCGRVVIQSEDADTLIYLKNQTIIERMVIVDTQLHRLTYQGFPKMFEYAERFAFWKELLYTGIEAQIKAENIQYNQSEIAALGGFIPAKDIVKEAHGLGAKVSIYTIFDSHEPSKRGCTSGKCDQEDKRVELDYFLNLGVDSFFVENVPEVKRIIMQYQEKFMALEAAAEEMNLMEETNKNDPRNKKNGRNGQGAQRGLLGGIGLF